MALAPREANFTVLHGETLVFITTAIVAEVVLQM